MTVVAVSVGQSLGDIIDVDTFQVFGDGEELVSTIGFDIRH
jgi:hypothetical protein